MELIPSVHSIGGMGVQCFLIVEPNGLTLVDTGLPGNEKKILQYITGLGRRPDELRRILITHSDADHVGALAALRAATGARVYASEIEARGIAEGHSTRQTSRSMLGRVLAGAAGRFFKAAPARVDEIVADGQVLPVLGGLSVVMTPGHTPGHVSYFAPAQGLLFSGDSLNPKGDKIIGSRPAMTWDEEKANESLKRQAALHPQIVFSAHSGAIRDAANKFP